MKHLLQSSVRASVEAYMRAAVQAQGRAAVRTNWGASVLLLALLLGCAEFTAFAQGRGKLLKRAETELRKGEFKEAEATYREALAQTADDKTARLGLSLALVKQNKLQEAYDLAVEVLKSEPLNARAHTLMGTALLRAGEFRTSVEALGTAIRLDERQALAIAGLSEIEYFENRARNAYDGLRRAVQLEPQEADYYISLARVCSRLELYTEAAEAYQRFLEVAPKTDLEKRERIRGLIAFYRYLGTTKIHQPSGKENTTIKFDLVRYRPFIKVMINGKGPLRFVIDTGASLSVLSETAAAKLGVKAVARGGQARAVGGSGSFPIVYGVLDSLGIGEVKLNSVPVYLRTVHHSEDTPESERADGYIGLAMLANYRITIDYQKRELTMDRREEAPSATDLATAAPSAASANAIAGATTPSAAPETGASALSVIGAAIPIRSTSGGLASTETLLPNMTRPLNFIIDTGATTTVVSKATVLRHQLDDLKIKGETYRVIGAAGIENDVEALGIAGLNVNGLRKNNARALILDLSAVNETSGFEQHGILGGDYLSHFLVQLDLKKNQLKLTPQTKAISLVPNEAPEQRDPARKPEDKEEKGQGQN